MYDVVKKGDFSMKKYVSMLFVSAIVLSGVLIAPSASASTSQKNSSQISAITGNHSFETANPVGYWKYKNIDTAVLPEGEKESYFTFTANKGERLYVRSSTRSEYKGMSIEIYNKNKVLISKGTEVINPDTPLPFIYAITDAKENNETFYVKVSRGSYTDDIYLHSPFTIESKPEARPSHSAARLKIKEIQASVRMDQIQPFSGST